MALRIRKDIKKSSYYVWFLGAKESKGIRGKEYILPVIEHLVQREKEIEPFKVTLQVSHKGLKIIQNVLSTNPKTSKPKNETIKHFIPHNTITCVYQDEDIVSCILLLYNPVTKCPLHVHVYRCDSVETATLLKTQLEVLIERPENQKKYSDLESRYCTVEQKKKFNSSVGSDTGTSTRESESSEERYSGGENRMASLYDSLAAELRQKLGKNESPILLPPRDYDTVHRQKGNLQGIDTRRCLNTSIVGQNVKGKRIESSGGSSGIGSDHPPSPDSPDSPDRFNILDNQSTSDEEWNAEQSDSTMYLMNGTDMILPRPSRHTSNSKFSPEPPKSPTYHQESRFGRYAEDVPKYQDKPLKDKHDLSRREKATHYEDKYSQRYVEENQKYSGKHHEEPKYPSKYEERYQGNGNMQRSSRYNEDFEEEIKYNDRRYKDEDIRRSSSKYSDERYYLEEETKSSRSKYDQYVSMQSKYYSDQENIKPKYVKEQERYYHDFEDYPNSKYQPSEDTRRYYTESKTLEKTKKYSQEDNRYSARQGKYSSEGNPRNSKYSEDYFDDVPDPRRKPESRQRSPTPPDINASPKDRFKDAKEKFLLLERERLLEQERLRRQEMHHSVPNLKDKTFLKRHESMAYPKESRERYQEDRRYEIEPRYQPKPAPRTIMEEDVRYRREVPLDRYRSPERYEKNRRSLYNQIEEDHKIKSNEIAKELKRRSYLENNYEKDYYNDIPDKRYFGLDKESLQFSKSNAELDKLPSEPKYIKNQKIKPPAGYRHSYAEPKLSLEKQGKKHFSEIVHRTNSSVSNSGRVGIASVNPY